MEINELNEVLVLGTHMAAILTGLSVVIVVLQFTKSVRVQNLQAFFYLHQYLSSNDFGEARHLVRKILYKTDYLNWTVNEKEQVNKVCSSYDQAGLLLSLGILDEKTKRKFLSSSWGESICDQYEILKGYLDDHQTPGKKGKYFFKHFVKLYEETACYHRKLNNS